ncbi:MAG: glucokinase [Burkholderiaceae bacterium]|nr:glucokinase [Burkholderiaceae bacterium]
MSLSRLLADIGGTNIRLAWQSAPGGVLNDVRVLPCTEFATVDAALSAYLKEVRVPTPWEAAFGIATPVTGDAIRMTNHSWSFSQRAVREAFGFARLVVINDFTALALALPLLTADLLRPVGGGAAVAGAAIALLGPGTGLGVSGLVFPPGSDAGVPLSGEGGHVSLTVQTPREFEVLCVLQERYGHVSVERAVSGAGLVDLYHALRKLDQRGGNEVSSAAQVTELALQSSDALALEALQLFCSFLGDAAGNLVLTLGARGGVYLGGGIVPRLGEWFEGSPFRARFEAKGRFQSYLAAVPCWIIDPSAAPALYGASRALDVAGVTAYETPA